MVAVNIALFTLPGIRRYGRPHPPPAVHAAAAAGLTAATGLRLWAIATLGRHWNVRASVPTTMIPARGGPYRWVRHPNYVAVAIEFLTVPLLGGGYLEAAALSSANAAVLWPRIRAEEALLDTIPAYRRAFLGTPRFVPRVITRRRATASRGPTGGRIPSTRS
jgi:methyltransferase